MLKTLIAALLLTMTFANQKCFAAGIFSLQEDTEIPLKYELSNKVKRLFEVQIPSSFGMSIQADTRGTTREILLKAADKLESQHDKLQFWTEVALAPKFSTAYILPHSVMLYNHFAEAIISYSSRLALEKLAEIGTDEAYYAIALMVTNESTAINSRLTAIPNIKAIRLLNRLKNLRQGNREPLGSAGVLLAIHVLEAAEVKNETGENSLTWARIIQDKSLLKETYSPQYRGDSFSISTFYDSRALGDSFRQEEAVTALVSRLNHRPILCREALN